MKKITKQIIGGLIGAIALGIFSGYNFAIYGAASHGCFSFIDSVMGDVGYLSCGPFGLLIGAVVGAILGVALFSLNWAKIRKMKMYYKPELIGGIFGLLLGILSYYILPILVFLGVFGSWLNFDYASPLYYLEPILNYPKVATIVFVILGMGVGFIVDKNQRK